MVLPTYHMLNQKSGALNGSTLFSLPRKPVALIVISRDISCNVMQVHLASLMLMNTGLLYKKMQEDRFNIVVLQSRWIRDL